MAVIAHSPIKFYPENAYSRNMYEKTEVLTNTLNMFCGWPGLHSHMQLVLVQILSLDKYEVLSCSPELPVSSSLSSCSVK